MQELEQVLDCLGWSALPVWARVVSVAYAAAIVAHGNLGVVKNLWRVAGLSLRGTARVGSGLAAWWARPSESARMQADLDEIKRHMQALMSPATSTAATDGMPCVFKTVVSTAKP